ncbi:MAG: hypothetical protein LUG18_15405 [Candidatus Azobacteroides sp.]|nr:hypothetical protein [Candidatus Azobacteroides sp.]
MKKLLLFFLSIMMGVALVAQNRLYVKQNGGNDANDGTSWENALATPDQAFMMAADMPSLEEIWVAQDKYVPQYIAGNGEIERDRAFVLPANVKVYGGFFGTENKLSERIPQIGDKGSNGLTILSGEITPGDTVFHVVIGATRNGDFIHLDGFTIEGARRHVLSPAPMSFYVNGQVVYRDRSSAIYCITYENDQAGDITLANNTVVGSEVFTIASSTSSGKGGTTTFSNNYIANTILSAYAGVELFTSGAGEGGTILFNENKIEDCSINASVLMMAIQNGRAGKISFTTNTINRSSIYAESAVSGFSTAVYGGNVEIINNGIIHCDTKIITGHIAAMVPSQVDGGEITVINNTFICNDGQALSLQAFAEGSNSIGNIIVANTLIWGNSGNNIKYVDSAKQSLTFYNCLVEGKTAENLNSFVAGYSGMDNVDATGWLESDIFASPSPAFGYYRLKAGSPAIDAGNDKFVPDYITRDAGYEARILGESVDIGAYEYFAYNLRETSGLGEISTGNAIIEVNDNVLLVTVPELSQVSIYTVAGLQVANVKVENTYSLPLPAGVYIISINGKTCKITI